ncbi:sec-independent protein translocase protein TatC [Halogranum rubrum]|uniref:Sec-independent protein translocase protein TatC n=1 Tax=Halogranum rubrum TaxID=553466 RepID=A0A1I4GCG3_9EURY|nr:twin-arginine translocase subunit TatC [Halogranum rubrum]SFL27742.1 sec-independent protein translocase protein TatC [Halogranum rubrum]
MGDESESDAEPTEQLEDRDDAPTESDETATPSTDGPSESSEPSEPSEASEPSEPSESVDDATSDDDEAPRDSTDDTPLDTDGGPESADSALTKVDADDRDDADDADDADDTHADERDEAEDSSEPPLQPDAPGDVVLEEDDDADEPFDPADSPALQVSESGFDDPDEGFGDPVADEHEDHEEDDEDEDLPGAFGDVEIPEEDFAEPEEFDEDDGLVGQGPETDQEMPLADHIEEMVRRLAVVFIIGGGVALSVFGLGEVLQYVPSTVDIINFLWNKHIPGAGAPGNELLRPHIYGPLELILTKLKVASLVGVVVGLPVFVYQSYLFMRPGLYQNERKYYLASVPTSLILAVIGVAFAHFVVLPSIFAYFTSYTEGTAVIAFGLSETFNLILILMGYMAIVFQIPLFIMLAIMMNLVTRRWLEDKRLIFWGSFLGLAFLVSPDPTGMAPIIIAITMVALFEGTLLLLRWTGN